MNTPINPEAYPQEFCHSHKSNTHWWTWMLVFSLLAIPLHSQQTTNQEKPETDPYAKGVAYKKEIGREPSTWRWNIPVVMPHVTHGIVHSKSMDRDVGYNIYLPPGYAQATKTRYPVVYYCHGATGSESSDVKLVEYLIPEIESGGIGEVIYVFVNVGQFSGYRDDPDENVMAETYMTKELIPAIDKRYRTISTRKGRALMGFSMGGGGATRLALKYPDLFCAFVSFAGALDSAPESTEANKRDGNSDNVYQWAATNQEKIRETMGLSFIVGGEDRMYERHPPFMEHLHKLDLSFNYRVQAHLGHDLWGAMDLFAGEAMRFLASHYERAR